MSKVYKGYELIKAIADGEIKEGSRFLTYNGKMEVVYKGNALWYKGDRGEVGNSVIIKQFFELIEDEIDIDNIEELTQNCFDDWTEAKKINELVQAVKQLNKEIKSIKEK